MSRVAKYRRQVSEDPDIDNLLSTLSPEEMEQLQKELDSGDPEAGVSAGLRRDQTERASSQREAERESKRLAQTQTSDNIKSSEKLKAAKGKKSEEESKEQSSQDHKRTRRTEEGKDTKVESNALKKESQLQKDERVTKMRERFRQDKNGSTVDKDKTGRTARKPTEEKSEKPAKKETTEVKTEKVATVKKETSENLLKNKTMPEISQKSRDKSEENTHNKNIPIKNLPAEDRKNTLQQSNDESCIERPQNGTQLQAEEGKEDESSSIFEELMEKVKNNEPDMTELNLNNSDCITIETLMSFAEALEFNTVVKIFSLANTRADDHIALAIAAMLKSNKTITSINLDSNHITGKGILAIFRALQHNDTLTELRFHNQRHICGGKTEMEIAKILKENTTLLKLGYHFELAGPRMTVTNLLSRNMDKQRQRRMAEQRAAQGADNKKMNSLEVPKGIPPQKVSPTPSPQSSPMNSLKRTSRNKGVPAPPPPPPPLAPLAPPLINENIRSSLSPASQRRIVEKTGPAEKNSRDQLLESIRSSNIKQLKKVEVPKWLK